MPHRTGRAAHLERYGTVLCDVSEAFQWLELFAGCRAASTAVVRAGYRSSCLDINDAAAYQLPSGAGTAFDILSDSGFASLGT